MYSSFVKSIRYEEKIIDSLLQVPFSSLATQYPNQKQILVAVPFHNNRSQSQRLPVVHSQNRANVVIRTNTSAVKAIDLDVWLQSDADTSLALLGWKELASELKSKDKEDHKDEAKKPDLSKGARVPTAKDYQTTKVQSFRLRARPALRTNAAQIGITSYLVDHPPASLNFVALRTLDLQYTPITRDGIRSLSPILTKLYSLSLQVDDSDPDDLPLDNIQRRTLQLEVLKEICDGSPELRVLDVRVVGEWTVDVAVTLSILNHNLPKLDQVSIPLGSSPPPPLISSNAIDHATLPVLLPNLLYLGIHFQPQGLRNFTPINLNKVIARQVDTYCYVSFDPFTRRQRIDLDADRAEVLSTWCADYRNELIEAIKAARRTVGMEQGWRLMADALEEGSVAQ